MVGTGFKLSVSREAFVDRLALVSRAVSARTAVLVLGGIQLRAENGSLQLAATDMELSLRTSLEADVSGEGEAVVPGRLLLEIARSLPEADVSIEHLAGESVVSVTCGSASYRVHTYSGGGLSSPTRDRRVAASARRSGRSRGNGSPGRQIGVARREPTRPDGHPRQVRAGQDGDGRDRLVPPRRQGDGGREHTSELEAIIPSRALQELSRLGDTAGELQLGVYENHVVFGAESTWLTTRRIDGQFPNYRQLLPEQFEHELQLPREELLDVVRRVSVMAQRNSPLRLRFADGELTVSAQTQDVGEAHESLPAAYAADTLEIGFNAEFLRDGLESIDSPTVTFKLISPLRPAVLEGETADYTLPDHADPARRLIVAHVTLRNYRSYASLDLALSPGIILVTGENGAGKTNLLEALHVGTQGFSPRTRSEGQLVRFGERTALVGLNLIRSGVSHEVRVKLSTARRSRPSSTARGCRRRSSCAVSSRRSSSRRTGSRSSRAGPPPGARTSTAPPAACTPLASPFPRTTQRRSRSETRR